MADLDTRRTDPGGEPADSVPTRDVASHSTPPHAPTAGRLDLLADLVAEGEVEFPAGLEPADERRLTGLVRQRLRARLVRFIARQIAVDIDRGSGSPGERKLC